MTYTTADRTPQALHRPGILDQFFADLVAIPEGKSLMVSGEGYASLSIAQSSLYQSAKKREMKLSFRTHPATNSLEVWMRGDKATEAKL
jgi:hypothetical protein